MAGETEQVGGTDGEQSFVRFDVGSFLRSRRCRIELFPLFLLRLSAKPSSSFAPERAIIKFTNVLDSRHPSTNTVPSTDTATFTLLPSGNTLEEGTMTNATTSLPQLFEEIWAPVPVPSGSTVLILESISEGKAKGFVGVCGGWALGVFVKQGGGYGGWKGKKGSDGKGWEVTWEKGEERVGWVGGEKGGEDAWKDWREEDEIEWAGRSWKVLEHSLTA